jgi:hypothetical protein
VHDFLTPQPVKDAAVFLLRYILHDWPDSEAKTILAHLRASAQPTSRLVVIERVLPLVAREDPAAASNSKTKDIPGAARPIAALPLLPNWGAATAELYMSDMTVRTPRLVSKGHRDLFSRL